MKPLQPQRVFIVDDHPLVRTALAQVLTGAGFTISGQAGNPAETLGHPRLAESGVAVVDLTLEKTSGIELIRRLREISLPVLVYSMHESPTIIRQAFSAGACGFVTKREGADSLIAAIRAALEGQRYTSPRAEAALCELDPLSVLSGQQLRIYRLLGQGLSNSDIGLRLDISVRTLESYCVRIMDKLGVQGIKELRQRAIRDAIGPAGTPPSPPVE